MIRVIWTVFHTTTALDSRLRHEALFILVVIARLKGSLVREEQAPGELMATFSPVELELHPPAQLDVVHILQQVETLQRTA